mmetsp:Transcript_2479/g.8840  ORF Transcript_2479/g.8840 Transcript_2479/m.8840 type:complete len:210 (+) Transcript_2479:320-949(+)
MASPVALVQNTCEAPSTICPGQSRIHFSRGVVGYDATDSPITFWIESFMTSSNSSIHFSTAPVSAGSISFARGTTSPSTDTIFVMVTLGVNSTSLIASKHFFMKGCTLSGSLASDRISRSSSFERKKKRGKASFLVSRKSLRPFSTTSSDWFAAVRSSSRDSMRATRMMSGSVFTLSMIVRHVLSMSRNAAPSLGIWLMISSEPKMGSR